MPTLCNHFHASVAGALPGLWHRANSWHDRRCRSGEWNKLPSFSLSATSSGNTDEHYMTEIATNVWLWKIMTHRRANTVTGRGKQTNCVWVISTLQVCRVNNKIKRSNITVHNMYWDLFTKHLEVETRVQGTYKPPRVGLVQRRQQQSPEVSILALSRFHLVAHLSRREKRNVRGEKKSQASQMKIPKRKRIMFDVLGGYGYAWPKLTKFYNQVPEGITCRAFNFSQLDFDAG